MATTLKAYIEGLERRAAAHGARQAVVKAREAADAAERALRRVEAPTAEAVVRERARGLMAKAASPMPFARAVTRVLAEDPDLAGRYQAEARSRATRTRVRPAPPRGAR